ncbi:Putative araC-like transcription regulator [Cupriavidus sp. H19C3]|uniref:AraC family transcriptional regulator n=1 Tax=Cupriavidus sp. H19C3 TaxID=3241603 RepID=UPI003BF899CD
MPTHDTLSQLLLLHPVRTELDTRCRFRAPWQMAYPAERPHVAPYHLVVEGSALVDVAGHDTITLQAGDMLVFPHGRAHRLYTRGADSAMQTHAMYQESLVAQLANDAGGQLTDILCGQFHFDAAGSQALADAMPEVVLVRTAGKHEFQGLQALVTLLRDETSEARPGSSAVVSHLASALFLLLLRAWLAQAQPAPGLFALGADARLHHALHAMLGEPGHAWTLEALAARCSMSRATFVRTFRTVAGATPGEVLGHIRMTQASQWLLGTQKSIAEIGEAVGYQSDAAFNRGFKRVFGVGPGHYRRRSLEKG